MPAATTGSTAGPAAVVPPAATTGSTAGSAAVVPPAATTGSTAGPAAVVPPAATTGSTAGPAAVVPPAATTGPGGRGPGGGGSAAPAPRVATLVAVLQTVRDPELDEPITSLGFVAGCTVSADGHAEIRLRLPTYFCAPNFAYLMVADAYDAISAVPGVRTVRVVLDDHFAAEAINSGVAAQAGFAQSFGGEAVGELHELRGNFLRKAVLAGTDQVLRTLGASQAAAVRCARPGSLTLGQLPPSPALDRLRRRRAELGLPAGDDAALLVDPATGAPVGPDDELPHLRRARLTAISIEANAGICRGMLRHRYTSSGIGEIPPGGSGPGEETP